MAQANPFQDPLRFERRVPPCALVIFGANGDLTKRKLLPSLYRLAFERRLPQGFAVLGISRTAMSDDDFRKKMEASVKEFLENSPFDQALWDEFARGLFYVAGDVNDDAAYHRVAARLEEIEKLRQTAGNVLFYLSTQPSQYGPAAIGLGKAGRAQAENGAWRRVGVEKPVGIWSI